MTTQIISDCAAELAEAYRTRRAITPIAERFPELTIDDAYRIQQLQVQSWIDDGAAVRGHKVGLSSRAMQRQLGVDRPDFGHLLNTMFYPDGGRVPAGTFIAPRVEAEIALILGSDLSGPGITPAEALGAIAWVTPALELIDSRIADWRIGIVDTVADNASSGGVVLGSQRVPVEQVDLRGIGGTLRVGGALVDTGAGGAVLGSPVNALVWLANVMGEHGVTLRAGEVILPGSVTAAHAVGPGDVAVATFDRIGSATVRFVGEESE
ncbi:2-keto-4-pentenoate hydratase [Tsukamurella spumae]|uniref:2-keto-4-pentenoate hydratase n=1 Tax=Tsukamurella spumae TaxID=44753 RepID=A0A846X629_9ACTN|nr:fumarylacetoacetate hydrolase family protein [Tsukamurella spumae]NKY19769.1 2-keto-4-pentenoate hydratase [Tsukamurella spumae]